ncbi:hypothetical protein [Leptothoe spongobia]|uniref:Uncharacterized protein n=1 Tax=Leptothoe spongobia TAU-MAC 1115 TaxID=1967444 RepID=A0A947DHY3_9CYAN|nr:hypothetical protein [Leptothoe spongobia]MBT9316266.1 hypothetical protein [Leptothoe spongobia TAU-MAC 1115]
MTKRRRRKKEQPLGGLPISVEHLVLFAIAGIATLYAISPAGKAGRETGHAISQAGAEQAVLVSDAESTLKELELSAEVGNQMYQQLCTMLTIRDEAGFYRVVAVTENTQYTDSATGLPVAEGELLCDDNGNVGKAILHPETKEPGYIGKIYRASDSKLINKRFHDSFDKAGVPVIRSNSGISNNDNNPSPTVTITRP